MNDIRVSIIFVNYNSTGLLIDAIHSIHEHVRDVNYEIIIVDNASPDDGAERLESILHDNVTIIKSKKNLGFGGANNLGILRATGKYLFFLNPDTILQNNAIKILYTYFEHTTSDIGAIGAYLLDKNGHQNNCGASFPSPLGILKTYCGKTTSIIISPTEEPVAVDFISGAALMIPKSVIDQIGMFDTQFFMYCEEADLQKRIADAGYRRMIIPQAQIVHLDGGSYDLVNKRSPRRRLEQSKSYCLYIRKHYSRLNYMLFRIAFFFVRVSGFFNYHYSFSDNVKFLRMLIS